MCIYWLCNVFTKTLSVKADCRRVGIGNVTKMVPWETAAFVLQQTSTIRQISINKTSSGRAREPTWESLATRWNKKNMRVTAQVEKEDSFILSASFHSPKPALLSAKRELPARSSHQERKSRLSNQLCRVSNRFSSLFGAPHGGLVSVLSHPDQQSRGV